MSCIDDFKQALADAIAASDALKISQEDRNKFVAELAALRGVYLEACKVPRPTVRMKRGLDRVESFKRPGDRRCYTPPKHAEYSAKHRALILATLRLAREMGVSMRLAAKAMGVSPNYTAKCCAEVKEQARLDPLLPKPTKEPHRWKPRPPQGAVKAMLEKRAAEQAARQLQEKAAPVAQDVPRFWVPE